jgi:hypothetical protein
LHGFLFNISSNGGSVARAKAANVSIMRLTQSIYTALRGESLRKTLPMKTMNIAAMLTVS